MCTEIRADSSPTDRGAVVLTAHLLDPVHSRGVRRDNLSIYRTAALLELPTLLPLDWHTREPAMAEV
jgi:hypothetical protein